MFNFADEICVNVQTRAGLLDSIRERLQAGKGFTIATLNLDHVVKLRRDPVFRDAYSQHSHITADGKPIVKFAGLAGYEMELVPGSELIDPVTKIAQEQGVKIAFFGSTEESLKQAADALVAKYPGLDVALTQAPPMGFDPTGPDAQAFIEMLRHSSARICFIAMGAPKQEIFAAFAQQHLPDIGFFSIGAGLDFISGRQIRAPKLVRKFGMEWLWRWAKSPGRLTTRYLRCIAILPSLYGEAIQARK